MIWYSDGINLWSFIDRKLRYTRDDRDECLGVLPCMLTLGRTSQLIPPLWYKGGWVDGTPPLGFRSV